jgi:hypothetical protein
MESEAATKPRMASITMPSNWRACGDIIAPSARLRRLASHWLKHTTIVTGLHAGTDCSFAAWLTGRVLTGLHPPNELAKGARIPSTFPRFGGGFVGVKWPRSAFLGPTGKRRNVAGASRVGDFALGDFFVE